MQAILEREDTPNHGETFNKQSQWYRYKGPQKILMQSRNMTPPFTTVEKRRIEAFYAFCMQKPDSHCAVCSVILYLEEVYIYQGEELEGRWPCEDYHLKPI